MWYVLHAVNAAKASGGSRGSGGTAKSAFTNNLNGEFADAVMWVKGSTIELCLLSFLLAAPYLFR